MSRGIERGRLLTRQPLALAAIALIFMALAVTVARPAGAENGSLLISSNADRSGATALDGATISGTAYIFLSTGETVQRVVFALDGSDVQVENHSPYDFRSTSGTGEANPWSTASTTDGAHSIAAVGSLVGGGEFTVNASFTVDNIPDPTPGPSTDGSLLVSQSANRSGAVALPGATVSGDIFAFLETGASVARVEFSLDGQLKRTEEFAPYDFAGSTAAAANTWDTASVDNGAHTISALVVPTSGSPFTVSAAFTVTNEVGGASEPTATPVAAGPSGTLLVSGSPNRSGGSALGATALSGDAFISFTSTSQLSEVRFSLDGAFVRTEKSSPYDLGGTTANGSAGRWNTTSVADGAHTIEVIARTAAGVSFTVSATFIVDNDPTEGGDSEVQTTSEDPASRSVDVFVSPSADRGAAQILGTDPLTGTVHVFAVPNQAPDRVRFYIDPDQQPLPARTESAAPYDLGGTTSGGGSGSFDTGDLLSGAHKLLVIAEYADGGTATKEVNFTVEHPEVLPEINYQLQVSGSADRSAATTLEGATLEEASYVFVSPADHLEEASFYLDDPARSVADRVDSVAPFDLIGGTASTAQPLDIDALSPGDHAITVVLTRTDGTTTDVHATFIVGGTNAPAGAISIKTTDNAAQVAAQHGAGATFFFEAGLHRGVSVTPQSGDVFLGAPGAILSGAEVLSGWNTGSGYWYVGGQTSELTGAGGCGYNANGTLYDACKYPEQLFVDGETWWQVTSIGQLAHGRWYFDYAANRVYVGGNPAGRAVELSTVPNAFNGSASGVTISGLVIEKYANRAQTGAIEGSASDRWTVSGNELRLNHGFGLRVGSRMQVLNNNVHHNGQLGVGGVGDDILVQGNEIAYNHTGGFLLDWEAGGTKFVLTNRLVVRDNWVHHNDGRGIWTDIDNINVLVVDNLVEYNAKGGIVHEIGYKAEIRENVSRYNGHGFSEWLWGGQIVVQNSSDVLVINNDVTVSASSNGGGNGITVVNQSRGNGAHGPYVSDRVTVTGNIIRHLGYSGKSGSNAGCQLDNTFDNNTYIAGPLWFSLWELEWCGAGDWDDFLEAGQEANGTKLLR